MNKKIILHIGLPKTATSFLQEMVFDNIRDVFYFGPPKVEDFCNTPLNYITELNKIMSGEIKLTNEEFNNLPNQISDFFSNIEEKKVLISNETLCGQIIHFKNSRQNALFLKKVFKKPKIVFSIRNQVDWAESIYNQIMTKHNKYIINEEFLGYKHGHTINEFFRYEKGKFLDCSAIYSFDWYSMIKEYIEIFGKENVLVLPYELLKDDLNSFLARFYKFTGLIPYFPEKKETVNPRLPDKTIEYSPILSKYCKKAQILPEGWFKRFILKNDRGLKKFLLKNNTKKLNISEQVFTEYQKNLIRDYYKNSNQELSKLIEADLQKYRYY